MKKKVLSCLVGAIVLCACMVALAACDGNVPVHTHNYSTLKFDNESHWFECICGEKFGIESHKGGVATCTELAVCSVCSESYGELDIANGHTIIVDIAVAATCTQTGLTEGRHCDKCNAVLLEQSTTPKVEHIMGDWIIDKEPELGVEGHKYKICTQCGGEYQASVIEMLYSQGLEYVLLDNGTYGIKRGKWCDWLNSILVIPPSYEGIPVTEICYGAFYSYQPLSKLILPDSITSIGDLAFLNCINLTEIELPRNIKSIGIGAFHGCGFTTVSIPGSVTSIGEGAFADCDSLIQILSSSSNFNHWGGIYLYDEVSGALICCVAGLEGHVTVPWGTTAIANRAFQGCDKLTSISLQGPVKSIGEHAFFKCTGLTYVHLNNTLTNISNYAFSNCIGLTSITIPKTVNTMGSSVFEYCTNLTEIRFEGTAEEWNKIEKAEDWNSNFSNYTIYCSDGEIFAPDNR